MMADYIRNGRFLALTVALIVVAGLSSLATLPRTEDPRVLNRVSLIFTPFPGATAERVEALVSEPIENEMRRMPEVRTVTSISKPGLSVVTVELKDSVTETATIWSDARDHLADVEATLPAGVGNSRFDDDRGYAYTTQVALTWTGPGERDMGVLRRYAKELQTRLRGVSGTDIVDIIGDPGEEVLVSIDPVRLTAAGLSTQQVLEAINNADAKVAAGQITNSTLTMDIEVAGEILSEERLRSVALFTNDLGETVHLRDVADVRIAPVEPPDEVALIHGEPGVVVAVRMLNDLRIDTWRASIEEVLNQFRPVMASNIGMEVIFDQSGYTDQRLGGLAANVATGFIIILAVLFVTLGARAAIIVALALPLTALFTLACMRYFGLPIHQMSVTGLVVALGIMVDNAIVMVDTIQQRRQQGKRALRAVVESISHLWLPLAGSTLTTILAFAPIVLMPGPAGEFVGGIGLSVMFALVGSYLISHTLIAGFAGRFIRPCSNNETGFLSQGLKLPAMSAWFENAVITALKRPVVTMLAVSAVPVAGFLAATTLTEQFFPPSDRDMFHIEVHMPPQTSVRGTEAVVKRVAAKLEAEPDIEAQHWFVGRNAPSFYYNMLQRKDGSPNFAQAMIKASSFRAANRLVIDLQSSLDREVPEAQVVVRKLEQGPPFNAPVELRLYGPNLERLAALGDEIRLHMSEVVDITQTRASLESAKPKVVLSTREEVARQTGLELTDLAGQLEASLSGRVSGSMLESTEELPVRVRVGNGARESLNDLQAVYLAPGARNGPDEFSGMPVAAIFDVSLEPARGAIARRNGQRVNTLEAYISAGVLPETVLNRLNTRLEEAGFTVPAGYTLEVGGESSERNEAVGNLLANVGVIMALLVLVVVLSFNSFRLSAIIFAVAAQSAGLGMLSVWLFGYPFGFTVIIGLLGLMGLAINAAIVILAELKSNHQAVVGDSHAIVAGVMSCTRHITSTTITTLGGFMPLILEGGGFWPPFAVAVAGGTVLTTLLSFFFAPAAFALFARHRAFELHKDQTNIKALPPTQRGESQPSQPIAGAA